MRQRIQQASFAIGAALVLLVGLRTAVAETRDAVAADPIVVAIDSTANNDVEAASFEQGSQPPPVPPSTPLIPIPEPIPEDLLSPPRTPFDNWFDDSPVAWLFADSDDARQNTSPLLNRAPAEFGDFFASSIIDADTDFYLVTAGVPVAGGSRRVKVAENNKALPANRAYFLYNHFHNALEMDRAMGGTVVSSRSFSVDRYTIGVERTLLAGLWSIELRMPFTKQHRVDDFDFKMTGGRVGNLSVMLKRSVYQTDTCSAVMGLGIDTPTGKDAVGALPFPDVTFTVRNEALHLLPFAGILSHPSGRFFYQGFLQVDVPTGNNTVVVNDNFAATTDTGELDEQTLLYLDVSLGCWLFRSDCGTGITGVAGLVEFHHTNALDEEVMCDAPGFLPVFGYPSNS